MSPHSTTTSHQHSIIAMRSFGVGWVVLVIACLLLCIVSAGAEEPAAPSVPDTPTDAPAENVDVATLVAQGDALLKAAKYEDALKSFTSAIKLDPTNFNTYYKRAGIYLLRGRQKNGLEDLGKVLELNPSFIQARLRRGKVRLVLGDFVAAEADLKQVLQDKPDSELAKKQLADLEKCSQDMEAAKAALQATPEEALRLIEKVLEIATDSKAARLFRARVYLKTKQYHSILEDTMVVLKQDSKNLEALFLRGQGFYYLGEREAAMKHYLEALKYDPEHSQSRSEFKRLNKLEKAQKSADENLRQNKFEEALQDFETAIQLEPASDQLTPQLWLGKCKSHVGLKQSAPAVDACSQALALESSLIEAHLQRAEAYLLVDELDKALHDYHKARELQPQNQQANEGIHKVQRLQKMAKRKDYYKILEITKVASDAEIRKAYRKMAVLWHPDKHNDDTREEAEKKYIEIAEAYEILSNEESRRKYDNGEDLDVQPGFQHHHNPFGGGGGGPFHFSFNFGG